MKNALLYCVNDNQNYVEKMVNSINSFAYHNPELLDSLVVYIFTDAENLDLSLIDACVKYEVVDEFSYDYSSMYINGYWSWHMYLRWEMFNNPIFRDYDNVLYLDCDTVVKRPIYELFEQKTEPGIYMGEDCINQLHCQFLPCDHYCNSGVIMATPRLFGKDALSELFQALLETSKKRKWNFPDQDTINYVLNHKPHRCLLKVLPIEYNYFLRPYKGNYNDIKILHYCCNIEYNKLYIKKK